MRHGKAKGSDIPKRKLPNINKKRRRAHNNSKRNVRKKKVDDDIIKIKDSYDKNDLILEGLHNAVHEFLIKRNFTDTVEAFQSEIVQQETHPPKQNYDNILMDSFDSGKRETFFRTWKKYVPVNLRMSHETTIKLEFYIHIYFAVFLLHPDLKHKSKKNRNSQKHLKLELDFFKAYLSKQGNELSKMNDLLPYFALPLIKDPLNHPTFSKIFTKDWVYELRNQLVEFINSMYSFEDQPFLIHMYQEYIQKKEPQHTPEEYSKLLEERNEYMQYVTELENNNRELVDILQDYHNKYKSLEDYVKNKNDGQDRGDVIIQQKWATFSREILRLANDIYGYTKKKNQGDDRLENYKMKLDDFQNFLTINLDDLMMNQTSGVSPMQPEPEPRYSMEARQSYNESEILDLKYPVLDFEKLKGFLASTGDQTHEIVCTILNSLRRRLAGNNIIARKQTLYTFIYTDAFDIKHSNKQAEPIFKILMNCGNIDVRIAYTRLLNMVASDSLGRSYLTENGELISLLIEQLQYEDDDSHLRKRCLGILQNLSLRKKPQTLMIRGNLIEACFNILEKEKNLSGYTLDYLTALLMNLCLRREGKERCELQAERYLKILRDLLRFDSVQIRTFVNGILFSILSKEKVKIAAREINLLDYLQELRQEVDERFQKQIDFIIEQAAKRDTTMEDSFEEEEDFDVDGYDEEILEDDVSEMQPVDDDQEIGEEFLTKNFSANKQDQDKIIRYIKSCMEDVKYPQENAIANKSYKPLDRPTTPSMMASNPYHMGQNGEETNRNLPSEMRHRPRLIRTPDDGVSPSLVMNNSSEIRQSQLPKEKVEKLKKEEESEEWRKGFRSRPKLPRTPFADDYVGIGKL